MSVGVDMPECNSFSSKVGTLGGVEVGERGVEEVGLVVEVGGSVVVYGLVGDGEGN